MDGEEMIDSKWEWIVREKGWESIISEREGMDSK